VSMKDLALTLVYTTVLQVGNACDRIIPGMSDEMLLRLTEKVLRKAHELAGQSLADWEVKHKNSKAGAN
jgi:hypothetical protein